MLIVGIAGGSGSGKTTVVRKIAECFPKGDVSVLPQDSYYRDNSHITPAERQMVNFDHPDSVEFDLMVNHLRELREGRDIMMPIYSYLTCLRSEETIHIKPGRVVIAEGILLLTNESLRNTLNIKVFVDADADDRLGRVIQRDIIERGRSLEQVLARYHATVKPSHLQFIEPSKRYADIIIPCGAENSVGIDILRTIIGKHLEFKETELI